MFSNFSILREDVKHHMLSFLEIDDIEQYKSISKEEYNISVASMINLLAEGHNYPLQVKGRSEVISLQERLTHHIRNALLSNYLTFIDKQNLNDTEKAAKTNFLYILRRLNNIQTFLMPELILWHSVLKSGYALHADANNVKAMSFLKNLKKIPEYEVMSLVGLLPVLPKQERTHYYNLLANCSTNHSFNNPLILLALKKEIDKRGISFQKQDKQSSSVSTQMKTAEESLQKAPHEALQNKIKTLIKQLIDAPYSSKQDLNPLNEWLKNSPECFDSDDILGMVRLATIVEEPKIVLLAVRSAEKLKKEHLSSFIELLNLKISTQDRKQRTFFYSHYEEAQVYFFEALSKQHPHYFIQHNLYEFFERDHFQTNQFRVDESFTSIKCAILAKFAKKNSDYIDRIKQLINVENATNENAASVTFLRHFLMHHPRLISSYLTRMHIRSIMALPLGPVPGNILYSIGQLRADLYLSEDLPLLFERLQSFHLKNLSMKVLRSLAMSNSELFRPHIALLMELSQSNQQKFISELLSIFILKNNSWFTEQKVSLSTLHTQIPRDKGGDLIRGALLHNNFLASVQSAENKNAFFKSSSFFSDYGSDNSCIQKLQNPDWNI